MLFWRVVHDWATFTFTVTSWFWGKKTAEVECPFNHVTWSTSLITGNADFYHLAEVVFVRLYHCQVTPFSPSPYCCIFWKEVTMCNSVFRNRELHSTSLRAELPMSIIWNSAWEICLLSHMYSVIYLYEYGPIDIHFILWGIIPKAELNLLHCSSYYSFGHWKLILILFDISPLL